MLRRVAVFAAVSSGGCHAAFGLEAPEDLGGPDAPALHDEDRDAVPDGEDRCPYLADPLQEDADGDGVGDACDPNPSTPGDAIVEFQPFHSSVTPWQLVGAWTSEPDAIVLPVASPRARVTSFVDLPPHVTIVATTTPLGALSASSTLRIYHRGSDAPNGAGCAIEGTGTSGTLFAFEASQQGPAPGLTVAADQPLLVTHQKDGDVARCRARDLIDSFLAATSLDGVTTAPTRAGIAVEQFAVRIEQVTVISSP